MEWLIRSIGVTDEVIIHLDKAVLAFQRPGILWIGMILLIPLGIYVYRRQEQNLVTVSRRLRIALTTTRLLILAVLFFVLAGPYLQVDQQVNKKPIVGILFDTSQSMQLSAGPFESDEQLAEIAAAAGYDMSDGQIDSDVRKAMNRISRAELAHSVVRASYDSLCKPLEEDYELRYYTFSRTAAPLTFDQSAVDSPAQISQAGSASHIGSAIGHVLEEAAGQQISGILVMSDGQNTGGTSMSQAARAAADVKAPIFVTPLGPNQRVRDVSLVDVYTSGLVTVGDQVQVNVTVQSQGFDGQSVNVELKDGNEVLDTQEVVVRDSAQQQVELTFEAKLAGARYLTVHVPPLPEESEQLHLNNTDTAFVRISEEKIRTLLIDGRPRWDFRFIKNAIRRDNGLSGKSGEAPDIVLETEWQRFSQAQRAQLLPQTVDDIAEYHTVILGDVSAELFTPELRNILLQAVREKGVGLIVAAGTQSMPHEFAGSFQDLLPVRLKQGVAGMEAPVYNPFRLVITPHGATHETTRLYDDPGRNQNVWASIPPYYWCAAVERPAPGATVLAWNPSVEGRFGKMPLIAYHFAGEGKVMFVGTDSTWLWRQNVGDRFFYKFWGQSIRFVARRNESEAQKSWIEVRPVRAQQGEETQIELMAFREDGSPFESSTQSITMLASGLRENIELTIDKTKKGRYTGSFTPQKSGVHRLAYQPSDGGSVVEATVQVLAAREELRHPNVNRPGLDLLASSTGGKLIELQEVGTIPKFVKGETELQRLHYEATIWDNWLVLLILVLTYSIDVGIRRLIGLS